LGRVCVKRGSRFASSALRAAGTHFAWGSIREIPSGVHRRRPLLACAAGEHLEPDALRCFPKAAAGAAAALWDTQGRGDLIPPLQGWTLAAIPVPSFCHRPKGQVAVSEVHLSVRPAVPAGPHQSCRRGWEQSECPPSMTPLAESSGGVMEEGRRCSVCSRLVAASRGSVPTCCRPVAGLGLVVAHAKPPAPAPTAGKGTGEGRCGCPGFFAVLNLEKVLGWSCVWQWDGINRGILPGSSSGET